MASQNNSTILIGAAAVGLVAAAYFLSQKKPETPPDKPGAKNLLLFAKVVA